MQAKGIEEEEDLDELDSLQLLHFLGKDFKDRTMVYLSGPNLMVSAVALCSYFVSVL